MLMDIRQPSAERRHTAATSRAWEKAYKRERSVKLRLQSALKRRARLDMAVNVACIVAGLAGLYALVCVAFTL